MATALLRDAAMISGALTGLPHARVKAKIGYQLLRITEPPDVADRSGNARGHSDVDAR